MPDNHDLSWPKAGRTVSLFKVSLGASLILNIGLALAVIAYRQRPSGVDAPTPRGAGSAIHRDPALGAGRTTDSASSARLAPDSVSSLEPEALAERLRALGFTSNIIYAVLSAQARDRLALEREELFRKHNIPFWRRQSAPMAVRNQIKRLEFARDKALAAAEFIAGGVSEEERLERLAKYGPIDPAKFAQLRRIEADYLQMAQEDARRLKDPKDLYAAGQLLEQNRTADLKALLSPGEYEEHQLRNSESARRLAAALADVDIAETEYRALMGLQEKYDAKNRPAPGMNALLGHEEAVSAYFDESRRLLGDDRFKKVFSNYDAAFRNYVEFVEARSSVKSEAAFEIFALEREMRARHLAMQAMPEGRVSQETAAAATRINERLISILGPGGAEEFTSSVNAGVLKLLLTRAKSRAPNGG